MADYLLTGKKGSGKSLVAISRMRDAIMRGAPVATNLDLWLENMLPHRLKNTRAIRLPDRPTRADLDALGIGNPTMREGQGGEAPGIVDEEQNGVIVLDELATWLNARTFADKGRQGVLDWLVHSRKRGWDTYLICQGMNQIDKQVRESLVEYLVICRRMDKLKVPVLGWKLPKVHVAFVKYGLERESVLAEKWVYRAHDLYRAYDTKQEFSDSYPHGIYSYLPPWHLTRTKPRPVQMWRVALGAVMTAFAPPARPPLKPKLPVVELVARLPVDQRCRHLNRLDALGLLDPAM